MFSFQTRQTCFTNITILGINCVLHFFQSDHRSATQKPGAVASCGAARGRRSDPMCVHHPGTKVSGGGHTGGTERVREAQSCAHRGMCVRSMCLRFKTKRP